MTTEETKNALWPIHVNYITSKGKQGSFVFSTREFTFTLELEEGEAIWFNKDMIGFYLPMPTLQYIAEYIQPALK